MSKKQRQIEQEFKDAFCKWWDAHGLIDSERAAAWQGWCAAAQALAPETIMLKLQVKQLREAFDAACAFIDSHVADPDMTHEMVRNYAEFKKQRARVN